MENDILEVIKNYFHKIGLVAEDIATKYSGAVTCITVEMDGKAQAEVVSSQGSDSFWFDLEQLTFSKDRIFDVMYPLSNSTLSSISKFLEQEVCILHTVVKGRVSSLHFGSDGSILIGVCTSKESKEVIPEYTWVTLNRIILAH